MMTYIRHSFGGKKAFITYIYYLTIGMLVGRYYKYKDVPASVKRVVFVCKGNICRSAFAEWYFKKLSNIPCVSFGLETTTGGGADARISLIAEKLGVDLAEHKTTAIGEFTSFEDDLFICVEPTHVTWLNSHIQDVNVVLLGWFTKSKRLYIHDPYAACEEYAETSLGIISEGVTSLHSHILGIQQGK